MRIVVVEGSTILLVLAGALKHDGEDHMLVREDAAEPHYHRDKAAASRSHEGLLVKFDLQGWTFVADYFCWHSKLTFLRWVDWIQSEHGDMTQPGNAGQRGSHLTGHGEDR